ncbi:MAG TPA: CoA transferase, partial [Candidatus Limnocylindria bacterium]|nr:CoA transferase [Candidatus Limnocylindria bacterium]
TNKRSITLDLESADGRTIFLQLAGKADVVIETYSPAQSDRLGLNYAQLSVVNPRLVVASITAFGRSGPWRDYKADDIAAIALGNLLSSVARPACAATAIAARTLDCGTGNPTS